MDLLWWFSISSGNHKCLTSVYVEWWDVDGCHSHICQMLMATRSRNKPRQARLRRANPLVLNVRVNVCSHVRRTPYENTHAASSFPRRQTHVIHVTRVYIFVVCCSKSNCCSAISRHVPTCILHSPRSPRSYRSSHSSHSSRSDDGISLSEVWMRGADDATATGRPKAARFAWWAMMTIITNIVTHSFVPICCLSL